MSSEIQQLHGRWHDATGEDMPHNIASQPIDRIRRAVNLVEKGCTVVVPMEPFPICAVKDEHGEPSLRYWDGHNEH